MAKLTISQDEVIEGFMSVFRSVGYEGASLEDLAKAAGLKKSSLYHRFPGGKEQMAKEVLKYSHKWINKNVVDVLVSDEEPKKRLYQAVRNIDLLYGGGDEACILRALSLDKGLALFSEPINQSFDGLQKGFMQLGLDLGFTRSVSKKMALDTLVKIQGGLILTKGTSNNSIFKNILKEIINSYTPK